MGGLFDGVEEPEEDDSSLEVVRIPSARRERRVRWFCLIYALVFVGVFNYVEVECICLVVVL